MWEKGSFEIDGSKFVYETKVFKTGSKYGINDGRISKLWIGYDDKFIPWHYFESCIVHYDRGWDIEPKDDLARKALEYVLNLYK